MSFYVNERVVALILCHGVGPVALVLDMGYAGDGRLLERGGATRR
jgi:hypothetical protein